MSWRPRDPRQLGYFALVPSKSARERSPSSIAAIISRRSVCCSSNSASPRVLLSSPSNFDAYVQTVDLNAPGEVLSAADTAAEVCEAVQTWIDQFVSSSD